MPIQKEILRPGKFTDANGRTFVSTVNKMKSIIANFNESTGLNSLGNPVSFTVAHPESDTPAFGWVKKFFMKGDRLWVEFKDVLPKMVKWLEDKSFTQVSAALLEFKDKTICRHIGCLGAWPPAVSALEDFKLNGIPEGYAISLNDKEDFIEIELSEDSKDLQEKIYSLLKDLKTNLQKGDNMPKTIEELSVELAEVNVKITGLEKNVADLTAEKDTEKARADKAEADLKSEKEKVTNLEKENKEFKENQGKAEEEKADLADSAEIDKRITAKKIMPAEKESILMYMKGLRGKEEKEYDLAEGKKEKMTPRDYFLAKLDERPELPLDDEVFQGPKKSNENTGLTKLEAAVKDLQIHDVNLSYGDAIKKAIEVNPELNKASVANAPA